LNASSELAQQIMAAVDLQIAPDGQATVRVDNAMIEAIAAHAPAEALLDLLPDGSAQLGLVGQASVMIDLQPEAQSDLDLQSDGSAEIEIEDCSD